MQVALPTDHVKVRAHAPMHLEVERSELAPVDGGERRTLRESAGQPAEQMRVRQMGVDHVDRLGLDEGARDLDRLPGCVVRHRRDADVDIELAQLVGVWAFERAQRRQREA